MYKFSKTLSEQEIKWIKECIDFVTSINIPISDDIYFKHCHGFKEIGWCKTEEDSKKADCTIAISIYLNMYEFAWERDFKDVCVHELLHTIKNRSKYKHKGSWLRYKKQIMKNYKNDDPVYHYYITERFYGNNLRKAKRNYLDSLKKQ